MFKRIEIAEQVNEGGATSKTTTTVDANHASHGSKRKELESAFPTKPDKGRAR